MKIEEYLPILIRSGLTNDTRSIKNISIKIIRNIKKDNPEIANQISEAINFYSSGLSPIRSIGYSPSPQDMDSRMELLTIQELIEMDEPIYNKEISNIIHTIVEERNNINKLTSLGLNAASTILLYGEPGVGKTMLAQYLAYLLNFKFASLDMSAAISSYLGKTGQNLKKVLEYAKEQPTILLLDEFDAIAKKRDDASDLGELKRVVNILLKELEDWPSHSMLIAVTNHPKLLDKAIWRRFEYTIEIPLPDQDTRIKIFESAFINTEFYEEIKNMSKLLAILSDKLSPNDIIKICEKSRKRALFKDEKIQKAIIIELANNSKDDIVFNKKFCKIAQSDFNMTFRDMAQILDKSISTIQFYLKGAKNDG